MCIGLFMVTVGFSYTKQRSTAEKNQRTTKVGDTKTKIRRVPNRSMEAVKRKEIVHYVISAVKLFLTSTIIIRVTTNSIAHVSYENVYHPVSKLRLLRPSVRKTSIFAPSDIKVCQTLIYNSLLPVADNSSFSRIAVQSDLCVTYLKQK